MVYSPADRVGVRSGRKVQPQTVGANDSTVFRTYVRIRIPSGDRGLICPPKICLVADGLSRVASGIPGRASDDHPGVVTAALSVVDSVMYRGPGSGPGWLVHTAFTSFVLVSRRTQATTPCCLAGEDVGVRRYDRVAMAPRTVSERRRRRPISQALLSLVVTGRVCRGSGALSCAGSTKRGCARSGSLDESTHSARAGGPRLAGPRGDGHRARRSAGAARPYRPPRDGTGTKAHRGGRGGHRALGPGDTAPACPRGTGHPLGDQRDVVGGVRLRELSADRAGDGGRSGARGA
jgi:hypothetical protein